MTLLPPTDEQLGLMNKELYQSPEITKQDVVRLKDWLKKQPHLPQHMDDTRLERFIYGCKFSVERSKQLLDTYYTVRTGFPEIFGNRDPLSEDVQNSFKHTIYFPLPSLNPAGYRVTIFRLADTDVDNFSVQEATKRIVMTLDLRLLEESCLNNVMIFDLTGFTGGHFVKCLPTLEIVRNGMMSIQDAFPMRMAQVHLVNAPVFIDKVLAMARPLFKEKLFAKLAVHSAGFETLYKSVPKKMLPSDYGGEAGTIQELNDAWVTKLLSHRDWFLEDCRSSKADESRRPRKCKKPTALSLADVQGTFRQLVID